MFKPYIPSSPSRTPEIRILHPDDEISHEYTLKILDSFRGSVSHIQRAEEFLESFMNYCSHCGHSLSKKIPEGDDHERFVCENCEVIHYQNPKIIVGCIPVWENKVLLCKRSIEPRLGYWTFPAGYMENGETVEAGAKRETREEANAEVEITNVHTLYSIEHINQVYIIFLANLKNLDFFPGPESLETRLFEKSEIPWDEIAFSSIKFALENYFENPNSHSSPALLGKYIETELHK